jgi:hypothetical protein
MRTLSALEIAPNLSYPRWLAALESSPLSSGGPESFLTTAPSSPSTLSSSGLYLSSFSSLVTSRINGERFNLEGKINAQWSRGLGAEGRMRIQNELQCCGYFSPFVEATVSQTCYARSLLPGCKLKYIVFERGVLKTWYTAAFALVPVHVMVMVAGLLCSNHVTYRFGKGMMPKAYRLSMASMAIIMENYARWVELFLCECDADFFLLFFCLFF